MFDKGKREQRHSKEDAVFNRMLLWLVGAAVVELFLLLVKQAYVNMLLGGAIQMFLLYFFRVFSIAGAVAAAAGVVWAVVNYRRGKSMTPPCILASVAAGLWVLSVFAYFLFDVGLNIVMVLPLVAAVLIVVFFLYQRAFFFNTLLAAVGLVDLWLYRQYYAVHPTVVTALFVAGFAALAVALVLTFLLWQGDGRLGRAQVMPAGSNYAATWITCGLTALALVLTLVLGAAAAFPLLFILVGWVFIQAVFFTVKLM